MNWAALKTHVTGALSVLECEVLADVARHSHATAALEVGHYCGLSTCVLLDSLPADCEFTTVDHHQGDEWSGATTFDEFWDNVSPHIGDREFWAIEDDMRAALPLLIGPYDFVFYDADHSQEGVAEFWRLVTPLLAEQCTLVFDDADWAGQSTLIPMAERAGFESVREREFVRLEKDKKHPETYTLEVMRRGS